MCEPANAERADGSLERPYLSGFSCTSQDDGDQQSGQTATSANKHVARSVYDAAFAQSLKPSRPANNNNNKLKGSPANHSGHSVSICALTARAATSLVSHCRAGRVDRRLADKWPHSWWPPNNQFAFADRPGKLGRLDRSGCRLIRLALGDDYPEPVWPLSCFSCWSHNSISRLQIAAAAADTGVAHL